MLPGILGLCPFGKPGLSCSKERTLLAHPRSAPLDSLIRWPSHPLSLCRHLPETASPTINQKVQAQGLPPAACPPPHLCTPPAPRHSPLQDTHISTPALSHAVSLDDLSPLSPYSGHSAPSPRMHPDPCKPFLHSHQGTRCSQLGVSQSGQGQDHGLGLHDDFHEDLRHFCLCGLLPSQKILKIRFCNCFGIKTN